jgi:MFS family permease
MIGGSTFQSRWGIVFASFLGLMVSQGPVTVCTFGVFLKPVSEDLGVSRSTFSLAFNLLNIMCAAFIPLVGKLIDRYGIRNVVMPMIVLFALTTAGLSYLQPSVAVLYGLFALQGLFSAGNVPTGYAKAISAWFDRDRGLALGIAIAGTGLGVALMPPSMTYLIQNYGWRNAYLGLGAAVFVLAFVPVALFIKDAPRDPSLLNLPRQETRPDPALACPWTRRSGTRSSGR